MNEQNPYVSPEESSAQTSSDAPPTNRFVVRVIEYAIAILLIIALMFALFQGIY